LDGVTQPVLAAQEGPGLLAVDLTRSTGFHKLKSQGRTYWFGTEDAKLALSGVEQMLNHLRDVHAGTTWTGQILFSSGGVLRDPHVIYGWFDTHIDTVLDTVRAILTRPLRGTQVIRRTSRIGGPGINIAATHRLLRANPERMLQQSARGLLEINARRYTPLRISTRHRMSTVTTTAHHRLVALISTLMRLLEEVQAGCDDAMVSRRCAEWGTILYSVRRNSLFREMQRGGVPPNALVAPRTQEEWVDPRYRTVFEKARALRSGFGWLASKEPLNQYAYVEYADQIYQAFATVVISGALGCAPAEPALGVGSGPAFTSEFFDVYTDRVPPAKVLRTWRSHSSAPDQLRPDILIHHHKDGRVLLLDAKYRASGNHASEDSRKEIISYMASYGLSTAVIAYPPHDVTHRQPRVIEGSGQRIIELPVAPRPGLEASIASELSGLLQHLSWGRY
jgi:hypothetical protein